MEKGVRCSPDEMSRLQYLEERKMTFEERLRLAFGMTELSQALTKGEYVDFEESSDIEWIKLKTVNDRSL